MFFYSEQIYSEEQMVSMLMTELDGEANRTGWQQGVHQQMSLF